MIEIRTLEIAGFTSAFQALRLPFGKECRSEANFLNVQYKLDKLLDDCPDELDGANGLHLSSQTNIHNKDLHLMSVLIKRGDEHAKVVRGIVAYAEIDAPRFWWQEMDTYRIGTDRLSSESTMHIQGKGMPTEDLIKMKSELTEGTMQKRIQMFSYQCLRRIYIQRRNHRLPHWQKFCEWIKTLPFANELILIGLENENN